MCYSAEASFAASGVLAAGSIVISRLPKEKANIPLSLIPAIFAAHQFSEGLVWLNQDGILPDTYKFGALYIYVLIAYIFWPIFIPFSAYLIEANKRRRIIILICQVVGLWVGFTLLNTIINDPLQVSADCCSLSYSVYVSGATAGLYLVAVSLPFLISSRRTLVFFGTAIALTCIAAALVTSITSLPSVWCFFAALLSAGLYLHFRIEARSTMHQVSRSINLEFLSQ
jgi:hypothetical protein